VVFIHKVKSPNVMYDSRTAYSSIRTLVVSFKVLPTTSVGIFYQLLKQNFI